MTNKEYKLEDFPFHYKLSTRWKDLDAFRHVNNAVFLTYVEDARIVLLKRWNINYQERSLIVASAKIDYLRQVTHPSNLIVAQKISRLGTKSFDINSVVFIENDPNPVCKSTVISVAYDFVNNKTVKVYQDIIDDYNL